MKTLFVTLVLALVLVSWSPLGLAHGPGVVVVLPGLFVPLPTVQVVPEVPVAPAYWGYPGYSPYYYPHRDYWTGGHHGYYHPHYYHPHYRRW
jgi:hypothetical protein